MSRSARGRVVAARPSIDASAEPPGLKDLIAQGMRIGIGRRNTGALHHGGNSGASDISSQASGLKVKAVVAVPDGRCCILCEDPDSREDYVISDETLAWGYPPCPVTKKNTGRVCYYCDRTFNARFKAKHKTVEQLLLAFGQDITLASVFKHWRGMAIEAMVSAGNRNIKVQWGSEERIRELVIRNIRETRVEEPDDLIMDLDEYKAVHGDFKTNGLGHKYVNLGGISGVMIPQPKVWRVKRARIMQASLDEHICRQLQGATTFHRFPLVICCWFHN